MKAIVQLLTMSLTMLVIAYPPGLAGAADFLHYQVILDRKPFGEPPPDSLGAGSNSVPGAQSFIKDIRMVAITEDGNGRLKVGFVDIKSNRSYYLTVGNSEDGIQVVEANYKTESALLKKETDEQWISMNADAGAETQPAAQRPRAAVSVDRTPSGVHMPYVPKKRGEPSVRVIEADPPILQGEAYEKHIREYNKNLIRGKEAGPPLPVALTEEDDAQLVAEGVLPPIDQSQPAATAAPSAGE